MASLPLVTVTGTIFEVDGLTEYDGPVIVRQPVTLRHTDGTVMLSGVRTFQVVDGAFSAAMAYCDAPGWTPDGSDPETGWRHELIVPAGSVFRKFSLFASVNDPDTVNLGDMISEGYIPQPGQEFASFNHTHADLLAAIGLKQTDNRLTSVGETAIDRLRPTGQVALADRQMLLTFFQGLTTQTIMKFGTTMPNSGLAVGSTHSWVGVYKVVGTNLVPDAVSVDDPSKWTAQGSYDTPIFDPAHPGEGAFQGWDEVAGEWYAAAFLWRGAGAAPQLPGATIWGTEAGFGQRLNGYLDNQDFPPTAPFPISSVLDDFRLIQAHFKR